MSRVLYALRPTPRVKLIRLAAVTNNLIIQKICFQPSTLRLVLRRHVRYLKANNDILSAEKGRLKGRFVGKTDRFRPKMPHFALEHFRFR